MPASKCRFRSEQGMSSAELRLLNDKGKTGSRRKSRTNLVRLMPNDYRDRGWGQASSAGQDVLDERSAGNAVEHFGKRRLHARSLAGPEY